MKANQAAEFFGHTFAGSAQVLAEFLSSGTVPEDYWEAETSGTRTYLTDLYYPSTAVVDRDAAGNVVKAVFETVSGHWMELDLVNDKIRCDDKFSSGFWGDCLSGEVAANSRAKRMQTSLNALLRGNDPEWWDAGRNAGKVPDHVRLRCIHAESERMAEEIDLPSIIRWLQPGEDPIRVAMDRCEIVYRDKSYTSPKVHGILEYRLKGRAQEEAAARAAAKAEANKARRYMPGTRAWRRYHRVA
jgi:hypothetical protein